MLYSTCSPALVALDYGFPFEFFWTSMACPGVSSTGEIKIGSRVRLTDAAGPRLASKHGTVIGPGKYLDAVRVKLDGSKFPITLHKKYLSLEAEP